MGFSSLFNSGLPKTTVQQFRCSVVSDSETPRTAARQASLSITKSRSLLKLMSIESVMPSNHLIPKMYPSKTCECGLIWRKGLCWGYFEQRILRLGCPELGWGLTLMTGVFMREAKGGKTEEKARRRGKQISQGCWCHLYPPEARREARNS